MKYRIVKNEPVGYVIQFLCSNDNWMNYLIVPYWSDILRAKEEIMDKKTEVIEEFEV